MRRPEARLWDKMRSRMPTDITMWRVENVVGEGMPDVYCKAECAVRSCWIELKVGTKPKRETTKMLGSAGMRPEQVNWHLKAAKLGLPTYILIQDDTASIYFLEGKNAHRVNDASVPDLLRMCIATTWQSVADLLRII